MLANASDLRELDPKRISPGEQQALHHCTRLVARRVLHKGSAGRCRPFSNGSLGWRRLVLGPCQTYFATVMGWGGSARTVPAGQSLRSSCAVPSEVAGLLVLAGE